jgi:photosystem II stability/assembly factor-like uncharacterized protein
MKSKLLITGGLIFVFLITTGQACGINIKPTVVDGGVYRSSDKGDNWAQKVLIPTASGVAQFNNTNIVTIAIDPEDNRAIYVGTDGDGMLYSYNSGDSWVQPEKMNRGKIDSIAIDPKSKCTIYVAASNRIYKSIDCSRTFDNIYFDTRPENIIPTMAIDPLNSNIIYAGLSSGDIIRSDNSGRTWNTIKRLENPIMKIIIDKFNNRNIYIGTQGRGIFKSTDGGSKWNDVNTDLNQYPGAFELMNLVLDQTQKDSLFLFSRYGILKSADGGVTWQSIPLLTPPASANIPASAVNPKNNKEIFYATETTFYRTLDGGTTWETKKLPTTRIADLLLIDPVNPTTIFMGTKLVKK